MEQPVPKGYVRTEMGKLVKKADQDAWDKKVTASMQSQWRSRGLKAMKSATKENSSRKTGMVFDKASFDKMPSIEDKMKSDNMKERKGVSDQLKKYNDSSVLKSDKRY